MQQVSDCDMVVAHDDDLVIIDGLGHDAVSGLSNYLLHFSHVGSRWKPSNQM